MTATKPRRHITHDDVRRSYAFMDLLTVCHGAADLVNENINQPHPPVGVACSIPGTIKLAMDKWAELHDALEAAQCDEAEPPVEAVSGREQTASRTKLEELCRQWYIVRAKLELDIVQSDLDLDVLMPAAHKEYRGIEQAILDCDPDTLSDDDLWHLLDLARILTKPDDGYTMEQEERGQEMLDLVRTTLTRRSTAARIAAA